jgi:dTDP-glucose 4,6-dehydratase
MVPQLVSPWFCPCFYTYSNVESAPSTGPNRFFEDFGVWKEAPVLIGTTKFEPLPDVKNIMITGGAGFM